MAVQRTPDGGDELKRHKERCSRDSVRSYGYEWLEGDAMNIDRLRMKSRR